VIVHLNGQLLPREEARIDPLDRGFIFGEGVYEGLRTIAWRPGDSCRVVGLAQHIERMRRGLDAAEIPFDPAPLGEWSEQLVRASGLRDAFVYWQVTGGAPGPGEAPRSRARGKNTRPTIFGYCSAQPSLDAQHEPAVKKVITCRDIRWELGWLKSISLMGNVMLAARADKAGCDEAILIRGGDERGRNGRVAEGLATNVLLALPDGRGAVELVTPALESAPMLTGVTRQLLLKLEPRIRQRTVDAAELESAAEIMLLGTTTMVTSIVQVDGRRVGDGAPGPHARRLLGMLLEALRAGKDMA
jgi:D-alanine transaminase